LKEYRVLHEEIRVLGNLVPIQDLKTAPSSAKKLPSLSRAAYLSDKEKTKKKQPGQISRQTDSPLSNRSGKKKGSNDPSVGYMNEGWGVNPRSGKYKEDGFGSSSSKGKESGGKRVRSPNLSKIQRERESISGRDDSLRDEFQDDAWIPIH
jgi:hypothetical protein